MFFIIPDVAISVIALGGYNAGLKASFYALAGALLGGGLMYYWGRSHLENVLNIFLKIPAIRPVDLERVREDLERSGPIAMVWGPIWGIPYKIYAAYAHLFTSPFVFVLISIPARMVRFVLVALATPYVMNKIAPNAPLPAQVSIVILIWTATYAGYFYIKRK